MYLLWLSAIQVSPSKINASGIIARNSGGSCAASGGSGMATRIDIVTFSDFMPAMVSNCPVRLVVISGFICAIIAAASGGMSAEPGTFHHVPPLGSYPTDVPSARISMMLPAGMPMKGVLYSIRVRPSSWDVVTISTPSVPPNTWSIIGPII